MPQKQKQYFSSNTPRATRRAGQDIVMPQKKGANQFPAIGATLSSYQKMNGKANSLDPTPKKVSRFKRMLRRITIKRSIITILIIGLCIGGYLGGKFAYDLHKAFGGNILGLLDTTKLKGEDQGRVNILLAGDSSDDPGHQGADLTDSIMLVSLDTQNNTGWALSIPRDLWVDIPNNGYQKINSVYEDGNNGNFSASGYPNGGMGELEQMVSQKFDIPIDYYALIDYTAFKQAVDAVGGINIDIQSTDPRGLYDAYTNLKLPNGEVTLNGQQALNLARARGDDSAGDVSYGFPNSDFDRTMHQRQMLVALEQKATTSSVLANPIKLSQLFDAIGNNVKTDFNTGDLRRLYQLSKKIPSNKITSLSLNSDNGQDLLASYMSGGQSSLIPAAGINNYSDIDAFVAKYTSNNPLVQEDAKVVILNATDTDGVATKVQSVLQSQHIDADKTGDAYQYSNTTEIIDLSSGSKPNTKAALVKLFGNNLTTTNPYGDTYTGADFIVVVGADQASDY
jgi:LCP family protein required for cell wall assembly